MRRGTEAVSRGGQLGDHDGEEQSGFRLAALPRGIDNMLSIRQKIRCAPPIDIIRSRSHTPEFTEL